MKLSKILPVFSALLVTSCFAAPFPQSGMFESYKSELVDAVVNILESCYRDRITAVGFAGNSTEMISKALWSRGAYPITMIGGTARIGSNSCVPPQCRFKLLGFVVTATTPMALSKTLTEIKASLWWNYMAGYLILDWSLPGGACANAFEMLWSAWELNLINAKFLCYRRAKNLFIYTYNPYMSRAPEPWQIVKVYSGKNNHPWTLVTREYGVGDGVCNELFFDKTTDLGGYEVIAAVTKEPPEQKRTGSHRCPNLYEDVYCDFLFTFLNATPKLRMFPVHSPGYFDDEGNPQGAMANIINGSIDVGLTARYLSSIKNVSATYPQRMCELRALTRYSGYKSQLSKILSVIDSKSRLCLCLVCLIAFLFFKYFARQPVAVASLSTVSIMYTTYLPKIPGRVAPRIILGCLLLCFLTMQGIFQGNLASLLTKQVPLRNVDTMRDLFEFGYTIYGFKNFKLFFDYPEFEGRYIANTEWSCTEHVLRNSRAACVADTSIIIYNASALQLHMSRETFAYVHASLQVRPDWPPEYRVNTLLQRSMQSHLLQHFIDRETFKLRRHIEFQKLENKDKNAKVLTLKQMRFAFVILGVGLGFGTLSFILEVTFGRFTRLFNRANANTFLTLKFMRSNKVFSLVKGRYTK